MFTLTLYTFFLCFVTALEKQYKKNKFLTSEKIWKGCLYCNYSDAKKKYKN